jgi:predicted kinase
MQLIIFIGIPGCGKSTFYQQNFFHTHLRINLDMLRTRNRENRLLAFCFQTSMPAVIDNTNVQLQDRSAYISLAKKHRFTVTGYYFESHLQPCLERNAMRMGRQHVSEKGIRAKYYQLQVPALAEGFDELYYVQLQDNFTFTIKPWLD